MAYMATLKKNVKKKGDVSKLRKFRSPEVRKFCQMYKYLIIRYHYSNDRTPGLLNSRTSPILIHPLFVYKVINYFFVTFSTALLQPPVRSTVRTYVSPFLTASAEAKYMLPSSSFTLVPLTSCSLPSPTTKRELVVDM